MAAWRHLEGFEIFGCVIIFFIVATQTKVVYSASIDFPTTNSEKETQLTQLNSDLEDQLKQQSGENKSSEPVLLTDASLNDQSIDELGQHVETPTEEDDIITDPLNENEADLVINRPWGPWDQPPEEAINDIQTMNEKEEVEEEEEEGEDDGFVFNRKSRDKLKDGQENVRDLDFESSERFHENRDDDSIETMDDGGNPDAPPPLQSRNSGYYNDRSSSIQFGTNEEEERDNNEDEREATEQERGYDSRPEADNQFYLNEQQERYPGEKDEDDDGRSSDQSEDGGLPIARVKKVIPLSPVYPEKSRKNEKEEAFVKSNVNNVDQDAASVM